MRHPYPTLRARLLFPLAYAVLTAEIPPLDCLAINAFSLLCMQRLYCHLDVCTFVFGFSILARRVNPIDYGPVALKRHSK
jgi:hypothetical protein